VTRAELMARARWDNPYYAPELSVSLRWEVLLRLQTGVQGELAKGGNAQELVELQNLDCHIHALLTHRPPAPEPECDLI
jgi:hypothetical protein